VSSEPKRVLLVEDDPVVAEVLTAALAGLEGVQLVHEADGRRALVRVSTGDWALVVSDIELPNADGLEVLRAAKDAAPGTPVVLMTAHEKLDYAIEAVRGHADEFLVKPVDPHELRRKVAGLLLGARAGGGGAASRTVLAIGAHAVDVQTGCGGTLIAHVEAGDKVALLALGGGADMEEARTSAGLLGVELIQRDLPAGGMTEGGETLHAITNTLERLRPTVVYTHSVDDDHQDRRSVHRATVVAARSVSSLFAYQCASTGLAFSPGRFSDVTVHIPQKLRALRAFESLQGTRPELDEDLVLATARYWSRFGSGRHVEPLEVVRESEPLV
jgi:CheY-like chemotaxis protein